MARLIDALSEVPELEREKPQIIASTHTKNGSTSSSFMHPKIKMVSPSEVVWSGSFAEALVGAGAGVVPNKPLAFLASCLPVLH